MWLLYPEDRIHNIALSSKHLASPSTSRYKDDPPLRFLDPEVAFRGLSSLSVFKQFSQFLYYPAEQVSA